MNYRCREVGKSTEGIIDASCPEHAAERYADLECRSDGRYRDMNVIVWEGLEPFVDGSLFWVVCLSTPTFRANRVTSPTQKDC